MDLHRACLSWLYRSLRLVVRGALSVHPKELLLGQEAGKRVADADAVPAAVSVVGHFVPSAEGWRN